MKIYAFTDTHGNERALKVAEQVILKEDVDVIVHAGDMTIFGTALPLIIKKLHFLAKRTKKPLICIHGNHEDYDDFAKECKKYTDLINLHDNSAVVAGALFLGFGGGGFQKTYSEFNEHKFISLIHKHKGMPVVFVTHAPPYKTALDNIGSHAGSMTFRKFIENAQPALAISGHLHETFMTQDKIKDTICINPGPFGALIEL